MIVARYRWLDILWYGVGMDTTKGPTYRPAFPGEHCKEYVGKASPTGYRRECRRKASEVYTAASGAEWPICPMHASEYRARAARQPGSATCYWCGEFISTNGADAWRDGRGKTMCGPEGDRQHHQVRF